MITHFADTVATDLTRLGDKEMRELQDQYSVNRFDAENEGETWFDEEIPIRYVEVIDEDEFFERYFKD